MSFCTTGAVVSGRHPAKPSMAAVESVPATSMLPLRQGTPQGGGPAHQILASASAACLRAILQYFNARSNLLRRLYGIRASCTRSTQVLDESP